MRENEFSIIHQDCSGVYAVRRKGCEVPWHSLAMTRGRLIALCVVLCRRVVSLANRQDAGKSEGKTPTPFDHEQAAVWLWLGWGWGWGCVGCGVLCCFVGLSRCVFCGVGFVFLNSCPVLHRLEFRCFFLSRSCFP